MKEEKTVDTMHFDMAKCDFDTLVRAEEIKADKKRFSNAMKYAKTLKKTITSMEDLDEVIRKKVYDRQDDMEDEE